MDSMESKQEAIEMATKKAKENLKKLIPENIAGYNYCLNEEIKMILKNEYNIDWEPDSNDPPSSSVD